MSSLAVTQQSRRRRLIGALAGMLSSWAARQRRRQRRATIELIHSSPHLLRDLGLETEYHRDRRP